MSLFGKKPVHPENPELTGNINNIIAKGTLICGDMETFGNVRIDGKIRGNLKCKAKVALGEGSFLEGNIMAQNAEIQGEVHGTITVAEVLVLKDGAVVHGDIITNRLVVESGAIFNGQCRMGDKTIEIKIDTDFKEATSKVA